MLTTMFTILCSLILPWSWLFLSPLLRLKTGGLGLKKKGPITHKDNVLGSQLLVLKIIMIQAELFQRMQAWQLALSPSATAEWGLSEGALGLASLLSRARTFPLLS